MVVEAIGTISFGAWLIAIGLGWIAGFAVQGFGHVRGWIIYYPLPQARVSRVIRFVARREIQRFTRTFADDRDWDNYWERFLQRTQTLSHAREVRNRVERLVVIKEACGNSYVAILFSLILIVIYGIKQVTIECQMVVGDVSVFRTVEYLEQCSSRILNTPNIVALVGYIVTLLLVFSAIIFLCKMHFSANTNPWRVTWTIKAPMTVVCYEDFERVTDAFAVERQPQGWGRAKGAPLIRGDSALIRGSARPESRLSSSFGTRPSVAPRDEAAS